MSRDSDKDDIDPILLSNFTYQRASSLRQSEKEEMARLNYMASRIRAALGEYVVAETATTMDSDQAGIDLWWWKGVKNEMDAAMAHIGHTAARMNIFLDIPFFLRGLSQSLHNEPGRGMLLGHKIIREIGTVDPSDPTNVVDKYLYDWWNYEKEWKTHPLHVDHPSAYQWHFDKYGYHDSGETLAPDEEIPEPDIPGSSCQSEGCQNRLHLVFGELNKARQYVQSLAKATKKDRITAGRHVLHLKALKKYQSRIRKSALEIGDVDKFYEEKIKGDVEMQEEPSAGTSAQSLSSQSLSFTGFTDSDSDYIP